MSICVVDTSALCELLAVPGKSTRRDEAVATFAKLIANRHEPVLPLVAVIETGNHIAHVSDGHQRRQVAEKFVELVRAALDGASPFATTPLPERSAIRGWIERFVDDATGGMGIADRSIIAVWEYHRALWPSRRVYIWSYDAHLTAYDTATPT